MENGRWLSVMGHTKLVAVIGIIASVSILILMPTMKWIAEITLGVVLIHIVILLVLSLSVLVVLSEKIKNRLKVFVHGRQVDEKFDAGWSVGWMNGFWVASIVFLTAAVLVYHAFPGLQLLALLLFLLSLNFFVGNLVIRSPKHTQYLTLPWVNLYNKGADVKIMDVGCGAGRSTIALAKIFQGKITAFDLFNADYIDGGGNTLLERNLKHAGITDRVDIVQGDVTKTDFQTSTFDAIVSSFMIDHLGEKKQIALKEINRILKPQGKMLMIVLTPTLSSFAILNVLSFGLTSVNKWKKLFAETGFKLLEQGEINGGTFFLIEK